MWPGAHNSSTNAECIIFLFKVTIESVMWWFDESPWKALRIAFRLIKFLTTNVIFTSTSNYMHFHGPLAIVCGSCVDSFVFEFHLVEMTDRNWEVNLFSVTSHPGILSANCWIALNCINFKSSLQRSIFAPFQIYGQFQMRTQNLHIQCELRVKWKRSISSVNQSYKSWNRKSNLFTNVPHRYLRMQIVGELVKILKDFAGK